MANVRSCASSRMTTLYRSSSGSLIASRSSMPSVMNLQYSNTPCEQNDVVVCQEQHRCHLDKTPLLTSFRHLLASL